MHDIMFKHENIISGTHLILIAKKGRSGCSSVNQSKETVTEEKHVHTSQERI